MDIKVITWVTTRVVETAQTWALLANLKKKVVA